MSAGELDMTVLGPWVDGSGESWEVVLEPGRVVLRSEEHQLDLPADRWATDVQITPHGQGFITRFDTFEQTVGFVLSREAAEPLRRHLGRCAPPVERRRAVERGPAERPVGPLLWPKVSPLAVWALVCSMAAVLPLIGWLAAAAAVVLLTLHHWRVRRTAAYLHSRILCRVALALTVLSVISSSLGWMVFTRDYGEDWWEELQYLVTVRAGGGTDDSADQPVRAGLTAPLADAGEGAAGAVPVPAGIGQSIFERNINWGLLAGGLVVVLLSLCLHEFAHAVSALWLGDDTARRLGRVTLNPMAHIDPVGTVALPLILFLANVPMFGWAKAVPVQPAFLPNPRRGHVLISLAGPGANVLLASISYSLLLGICATVALTVPGARIEGLLLGGFGETVEAAGFVGAPVVGAACTVLRLSFFINLFLAMFNLLPIPPLDGSWVLEHMSARSVGRMVAAIRPFGFMILLALLWTGALGYLLVPGIWVVARAMLWLHYATGFV